MVLLHELILKVLNYKHLIEFAVFAFFHSDYWWIWDLVRAAIDHELYRFVADLM